MPPGLVPRAPASSQLTCLCCGETRTRPRASCTNPLLHFAPVQSPTSRLQLQAAQTGTLDAVGGEWRSVGRASATSQLGAEPAQAAPPPALPHQQSPPAELNPRWLLGVPEL